MLAYVTQQHSLTVTVPRDYLWLTVLCRHVNLLNARQANCVWTTTVEDVTFVVNRDTTALHMTAQAEAKTSPSLTFSCRHGTL